ncbi:MAG TPA: DUF4157 domain-containing protein [Acidimicrobiales bacterium]|nr:DUF4157 domain-containing protein [Acidimicrobiales bacterium]
MERETEQAAPEQTPASHTSTTSSPAAAGRGGTASLLALQRSAGNRATAALVDQVQRKLVVGAADDRHEREADAVAEQVVRALRQPDAGGSDGAGADGAGGALDQPLRRIQRRAASSVPIGPEGGEVADDQSRRIAAAASGGRPFDPAARAPFEQAMGADLSSVRLHEGPEVRRLNDELGARAFTLGRDVFFRDGVPDASSSSGQSLLAHELTHTVQQGAAGVRRSVPPTIQRDKPAVTVVRRSDHEATLQQIAMEVIGETLSSERQRVLDYLRKGLGVGGASRLKRRSPEVRAFRAKMKDAADARSGSDIDTQLASDTELGPATKAHVNIAAKGIAHGKGKKSVDSALGDEAESWLSSAWDSAAIRAGALNGVKDAAWAVLAQKPTDPKRVKAATTAASKAAKATIGRTADTIKADARVWKNQIVKPDSASAAVTSAAEQSRLAQQVDTRTGTDKVGEKSIEKAITANTTDEGLGIVGKLLDSIIPAPGDAVSLAITLKIPIPETPAYVSLKLEGKAGRGTTGFTTSGVTTLGDPKRLEVMAKFSVGLGAEAFGLAGDFSVGFFVRAGANEGTAATMKALSYGSYRSAMGINKKFAYWWSGKSKGTDLTDIERSEAWAAMIEEQVFGKDDSAFADLGGSIGVEGEVNAGFAKMGAGAGGEYFTRYNQAGLKESLGDRFAQPLGPGGAAEASTRAKDASGRTYGSFALSASAEVGIGNENVEFAASFSAEKSHEDDVTFRDNWGVEISASIGMSDGCASAQMAKGIISGLSSAAQNMGQVVTKSKVGSGLDVVSDVTRMLDGSMEGKITEGIASAWKVDGSTMDNVVGDSTTPIEKAAGLATSSSLTVALTFGKAGGKWVYRLELRDAKSLEISIGGGTNVGASIEAERSKRLFAIGGEQGDDGEHHLALEVAGFRPLGSR